jgi:hypothetical protein
MAIGDDVTMASGARILAFAAAFAPLQACAAYQPAYSAKAIEAWVVDSTMRRPVEGVVAVAHWELSAGAMSARSRLVQLKILETATDRNGRLFFPAWGPELNPTALGYIEFNDPGIVLFKSGFAPMVLHNQVLSQPRPGALRESDWNGKTIALRSAAADEKAYLRELEFFNQALEGIVREGSACDWASLPMMLKAVHAERQLMESKGIRGGAFGISSVDRFLVANAERFSGPQCGSPKQFFGVAR